MDIKTAIKLIKTYDLYVFDTGFKYLKIARKLTTRNLNGHKRTYCYISIINGYFRSYFSDVALAQRCSEIPINLKNN